MTLEIYSTVLTIGLGGIALTILMTIFGYFLLAPIRQRLLQIDYFTYIKTIGVFAITATLGALFYQFYYATPVCELCWWQRIFLYPVSVITFVALWYRTRETHVTVGILALGGFWYACYHYYYHFQAFVLGKTLSLPCSYGGLMPACTDSPVLVFGFITIPFMGIMIFGSMLIVSGLAYVASKRLEN